ncbi:MAG TPA: response regulator [Oligoflexus sp.]|uniref:response regulator n=1 Tax=Oligoflexus sp. TaxID=1971216 RepID=UPI002D561530|nr:response regulator [Oligoflexus sp.]HYX34092.1 response regulator [Oligoflexus sp.]
MSKKILVVDDSVTARRLVVSHLAGLNLQVIEAGDGKDGLSKLHDHPDTGLIFTDINMPWMSGLEMIAELKKVKAYQHIPICMLTTETGSDALTQAKDLGVNAFLVKPVQKEQLLAIVNGYLHSA